MANTFNGVNVEMLMTEDLPYLTDRLLPLQSINTDITDELKHDDLITTRYPGPITVTAKDTAAQRVTADNAGTIAAQVRLGTCFGTTIKINERVMMGSPQDLMTKFIRPAYDALALDVFQRMMALRTIANYSDTTDPVPNTPPSYGLPEYVCEAGDFDVSKVNDINKLMETYNIPESQRNVIVGTDYWHTLMSDPAIINIDGPWNEELQRTGEIPQGTYIRGVRVWHVSNRAIPDNDENLGGFAGATWSSLMASRPVPIPPPDQFAADVFEIMDPKSGIRFQVRMQYDGADYLTTIFYLAGFGPGNRQAGFRIVSAANA
jgi:hypothetical protein